MVTIFSCPKPFEGKIGSIQRNAIKSWQLLYPKPEIILIGNEPGVEEICREFSIIHVKEVEHNEYGTPLVSSLFKKAQAHASRSILCYINGDIMLTNDFMDAVELIKEWKGKFLMIGRRYDVDIKQEVNFNESDWVEKVKLYVKQNGRLHPPTGIDYFIFKKGEYFEIPPFVVGRPCWDGWFVYQIRNLKIPVIDATNKILAIHQNHQYPLNLIDKNGDWNWSEREVKNNFELSNGFVRNNSNTTHRIRNNRIRRRNLYLFIEPAIFFLKNFIKQIGFSKRK